MITILGILIAVIGGSWVVYLAVFLFRPSSARFEDINKRLRPLSRNDLGLLLFASAATMVFGVTIVIVEVSSNTHPATASDTNKIQANNNMLEAMQRMSPPTVPQAPAVSTQPSPPAATQASVSSIQQQSPPAVTQAPAVSTQPSPPPVTQAPAVSTQPSPPPTTSNSSVPASEQEPDTIATLNNVLVSSQAWADKHHVQRKLDWEALSDYNQQDYDGGFSALTESANKDDAIAETMLGIIYLKGTTGTRQNMLVGGMWLFKAARQGLPLAQYYLVKYASNKDMPEKYKSAAWLIKESQGGAAWLATAAQSANAGAQKYMHIVETVDKPSAADLAIAPADSSSASAEQSTDDTSQLPPATDFKSASSAAEEGDTAAQYNLGVLYMQGEDIPQDYIKALKWLILAKAGSKDGSDTHKSATAKITAVESLMTKSQVAQAQQEASAWFRAHG